MTMVADAPWSCDACGAGVYAGNVTCPGCGKPVDWQNLPPTPVTGVVDQRATRGGGLGDFFAFRAMITPSLIKLVYGVGAIVVILYALSLLPNQLPLGVVILVGGSLAWRMVCEYVILFFSIHERLAAIERSSRPGPPL